MAVWTAEREISSEAAAGFIATQFPALAPVTAELMGAGWDNSAFLVSGQYVFRFPRRQIAVPLLEIEAAVLPEIATKLPLPIPAPQFVGMADGWPFAGYPLLLGQTLCTMRLTDKERRALALPLAAFLRTLHALPVPEATPPDTIRRLDLESRLPQGRERLAKVGCDPELLTQDLKGWTPRTDTLVHGDLYVRHLLVGADRKLSGVIDWGDLHRGDPAIDLSIAFIVLPEDMHAAFRATYGPISDDTWTVARLRALWHTATVRLYAQEIGDTDLLHETEWTLARA